MTRRGQSSPSLTIHTVLTTACPTRGCANGSMNLVLGSELADLARCCDALPPHLEQRCRERRVGLMKEPVTIIRQMLDACIRGEDPHISELGALERRTDLALFLASAVHEMRHFVDDKDIRSRDPEHVRYWHDRLLGVRERLVPA